MLTIGIVALDAWHAAELERAWRREGHRVIVVTADPEGFSGAELRASLLGRLVEPAGRIGMGPVGLAVFTRRARQLLARERPDLVVALPGTALELLGLAPTTVLLADCAPEPGVPLRPAGRSDLSARYDEERRRAVVIAPTDLLASRLSGAPVVLQLGLPSASFPTPPAPDGPVRFTAVGGAGRDHGADRLDLLARLADTEYVSVVDDGSGIADDLAPGVRCVGEQDRAGVAEVLRGSHAFALLARSTSGAAAGLDALASGLPVLTTESSVLAGLCAAGAGVVVPDDGRRRDYEDAVLRLRRDWSALSQGALELARERPWSVAAEELLDLAEGRARVA
ncbi:glycosyltransferase [Rathayibacter tritici]|uniref:glycosyltransferase n=1 Tax=Rathayibacter tritici TaxID=33888 RepID=UPI00082D5DF2|nr:glycosyltransferase [Rathayibacter tritici]